GGRRAGESRASRSRQARRACESRASRSRQARRACESRASRRRQARRAGDKSCEPQPPGEPEMNPGGGTLQTMRDAKPPLLVIAGPTGVGKTAAAVALARRVPLEVISADSRQVYRGMDLATGKPTAEEQAAVTHHLIDVVDP